MCANGDLSRLRIRATPIDPSEDGILIPWFREAILTVEGDTSRLPYAEDRADAFLRAWQDARGDSAGSEALVVGCALGDDAEYLARRGWKVVATDTSSAALRLCQFRFDNSQVCYLQLDPLLLPPEFRSRFKLVVCSQLLHRTAPAARPPLVQALAETLLPGGVLLVIGQVLRQGCTVQPPPWPLGPEDFSRFLSLGLTEVARMDDMKEEEADVYRALVALMRPI
jgi:SAM-dependent methyltransferase